MRKIKFRKLLHITSYLDKRQKFAVQTIILTVGLIIAQLILNDFRFILIFFLALASYGLSVWSLTEDITGVEWLTLFILPVFYTASVSMFFYLLPARMYVRIATTIVFAVGTYAILLIENIYHVAAIRSIQLLRVAQSVGLLLSLVVVFLSALVVYSLRLPFYVNFIVFFPLVFILSLQSLWSIKLEPVISKNLLVYTAVIATGVGELALTLSFWPLTNTAYGLLIASVYYSLTGVIQHHFMGRLFKDTIREYVIVFFFTLILAFIVAKWGG